MDHPNNTPIKERAKIGSQDRFVEHVKSFGEDNRTPVFEQGLGTQDNTTRPSDTQGLDLHGQQSEWEK